MELSEKIRELRRVARLSQAELALEVGCSQVMISQYELGYKKPRYDILIALVGVAKKFKTKVKIV